MTMQEEDLVIDYKDLLEDALEETGLALKQRAQSIAVYMAERAAHLATIAHEPGFEQAVRAERNSVALRAGLSMSAEAESLDQRIIGIIQGALRIGAAALV
jgi:hypothetical protein